MARDPQQITTSQKNLAEKRDGQLNALIADAFDSILRMEDYMGGDPTRVSAAVDQIKAIATGGNALASWMDQLPADKRQLVDSVLSGQISLAGIQTLQQQAQANRGSNSSVIDITPTTELLRMADQANKSNQEVAVAYAAYKNAVTEADATEGTGHKRKVDKVKAATDALVVLNTKIATAATASAEVHSLVARMTNSNGGQQSPAQQLPPATTA